MPFPLQTTAPAAAVTIDSRGAVPMLALVIIWCDKEPWREGEIAFFPPSKTRWIGRGGEPIEEFASWDKHLPGDSLPAHIGIAGCLHGDSLSRRQAEVKASAVDLTVQKKDGGCTMLVNGKEAPRAIVGPGDALLFVGEVGFLCVLRSPDFPPLRHTSVAHRFGERDRAGTVGEAPEAYRVRDEATRLGRGTDFILILGETGTGKTAVARLIHDTSSRASGPFRRRNSITFTDTLLATLLFGKIANFPNGPAVVGDLPAAERGTLFLDEIGRLSTKAQGCLLTTLEDGMYQTLGESKERKLDVRFLGATNLERDALQGDFGYRFPLDLRLTPLRERREDIALLAREMLRRRLAKDETLERFFMKAPTGEMYPRMSGRLMDFLVRHELQGNTRELDALLATAIGHSHGDRIEMFSGGRASQSVRPVSSAPVSEPPSTEKDAADGEDGETSVTPEAMVAALESAKGNVSRAAKKVGVQRSKFYRIMRELGIKGPGE